MFIEGLALIPIGPLCFAFAVEMTYPIGEAFSNGLMISTSLISGVAISYLTSLFYENGVNILEFLSCWTDTLFIIDEKDLNKAINFLKF